MAIDRIRIESREQWLALRRNDVTASVVGALFGLHPYTSALALYAEKIGLALPEPEPTVLERGRFLEVAVGAAFAEAHSKWQIAKAEHYLRDGAQRIGATPDFLINTDDGRRGVLQCKTVAPGAFRRYWSDVTPPTWISLQTLTEAMLDEADFGIIAALVIDPYRLKLHEYEVPRHHGAEARIRGAVEKFWRDVEIGAQPKVDYERDRALLGVIYPREKPGKIIDLRGDNRLPQILEAREHLKARISDAEADLETLEAEIIHKLGDAEAAQVNGWKVTLKEQHRKQYTVKPTSFRVLRTAREQEKAA